MAKATSSNKKQVVKKSPELNKLRTERNRVQRILNELKKAGKRAIHLAQRRELDGNRRRRLFDHMDDLRNLLVEPKDRYAALALIDEVFTEAGIKQIEAHKKWAKEQDTHRN